LSGQILQRSLFAAVDASFSAIVTSHTHTEMQRVSQNTGKSLVAA